MNIRPWRAPALTLALWLIASATARADEAPAPRKILVELYSSQGCNSCPPASDLLGTLEKLGYGPDQIVPVNFHVDYFNRPWVDPFSDPAFSARQLSYNDVLRRDDLYFTPLMMIDGRYPLLGSNKPKALDALGRQKKEPAGVTLRIALSPAAEKNRKTLTVAVTPRTPALGGREVLVGVALTEDPVSTKVASGENGGKTLVEHHVVRRFTSQTTRLDPKAPRSLTFEVEVDHRWAIEHMRVAVFVQDRATGKVHQADSLPWTPAAHDRAAELQRALELRRQSLLVATVAGFDNAVTSFPPGSSAIH